jgi:hypothetical protein
MQTAEAVLQVAGTVVSASSHASLVVQQFFAKRIFLSSPNHHTLRISLQVTFDVSYSGNWPQWDTFCNMEDIILNVMTELQKIPKEAFCQLFQQWQD